MSPEISKKLRRLEDFLLSVDLSDDAMLLSELDGFLAGLIVGPDLVMPSEWLPVVWGGEEPAFENARQAQSILNLIMGHYNNIIRDLNRGKYRPIYDVDIDDSFLWETWIEGFWRALRLRPDEWLDFCAKEDNELQQAVFTITRLREIASTPASKLEPLDIDAEMKRLAPDLIPHAVQVLHKTRLAQAKLQPTPDKDIHPRVGRNDPCPCGSGKKFKKCCLN